MMVFIAIVFFVVLFVFDYLPLFHKGDTKILILYGIIFITCAVVVFLRVFHVTIPYIYPTMKDFLGNLYESITGG